MVIGKKYYITLYCPWCGSVAIEAEKEVYKSHYRQHIYDDLIANKINKKEASKQRQEQLIRYLAVALDIDISE